MSDPDAMPQLKVGAHVLVQLGSELVTDAEQALLECVKNAYDADATSCEIVIDTRALGERSELDLVDRLARFDACTGTVKAEIQAASAPLDDDGKELPGSWCRRVLSFEGSLAIVDGGDGMTPEQLRSSWLTISGSAKRGAPGSVKKKTTGKSRTPLGDKGLGRLGTMKLGDILVVETATAADERLSTAQFRWADCGTAETVDEIPVKFGTLPNPSRFKGTRVSILGLNDLAHWRQPDRITNLTASLAKLVSPFEATSTFPVTVRSDKGTTSLVSVTNEILGRAVARFDFSWQAGAAGHMELVATAYMQRRLLAPTGSSAQRKRTDLVFADDGGAAFEEWLRSPSKLKGYARKEINSNPAWYVELERRYSYADILVKAGVPLSNPGCFKGSFYFFHLSRDAGPDTAAAGVAVTSGLIKGMTGIAILRDGFRVRSHGDWLELSAEMTSGSSYGLRVDNTVGYFALTGAENPQLIEKSDREGFVEDSAYLGFMEVARRCRRFASDSLEIVRRSADEFARRKQNQGGGGLEQPGAPMRAVEQNLKLTQQAKLLADRTVEDFNRGVELLQNEAAGRGDPDATVSRAMALVRSATVAMSEVRGKLVAGSEPDRVVEFLKREFDDKQEQIAHLYESAAVGLSARGLVHELRTLLDEIRQRTASVETAAKSFGGGKAVLPHLRAIRSSCSAITNIASLIDPMLPRSRTVKETFRLEDFIASYADNRAISMEHDGIRMTIDARSPSTAVRMNRPRLLQVLDNLVQNSRYWIRRGRLMVRTIQPGEIEVVINDRGFTLSDTGPGVDPHVEERLFELFVSGRREFDDGGQGLGLYISSQLLAIDGCSMALLEDRNVEGRRYRFEVNLTSVLVDKGTEGAAGER